MVLRRPPWPQPASARARSRRGSPTPTDGRREADRRALASIGIDLDRVLDAAGLRPDVPTSRCRTRRWRRARPASPVFSPRAKKALELALREALRLADRTIGPEHLLLGVLREGDGLACRILVDQGVSIVALRRQLEAGRRRAG